ncbi:MAG: 4-(cytidine 5'-diphospho)-2-C-methyl-D-erythritol kinase [Defluviitaleaceae bacterium]|nr:4-(cytidine 5'-diphospho)-2-C-methyl-D-erythritol kinase [Defluviitaleaceae bacterium]
MDYVNVYANAKINLALDVVGKREDGYHELSTIMQTIALKDKLTIRKLYTNRIKLNSNVKWLPNDERNLAYAAAKVLLDMFELDFGVLIEIDKKIPICAGLGGGSADAAATLLGIKKLFNLPVSMDELMEIGLELGADVPFCLMKGTALAEGIGEELTPLPPCPDTHIVIAKPPVSVSTKEVFRQFKQENVNKRPDINKMIQDIENGDIKSVASGLVNVLESVTVKEFVVIERIKRLMLLNGAIGATMSGSGPTVFGMFEDKPKAQKAISQIRVDLNVKEIFLTNIFTPNPKTY